MKKLLLTSLVGMTITSAAAFAQDPTQVVEFRGVITKGVAGDKTAITGQNGGVVSNGELALKEDGSFDTLSTVVLEHHKRDSGVLEGGTGEILPDLVTSTDWSVTQLQYFVNGTQIRSNDLTLTDLDGETDLAKVVDGTFTATNKTEDTTSKVTLSVSGTEMTGDELTLIQPGINVGVVYATVTAKEHI